MAYLGRGIENLSDRVVLDSLTASATASYTLQLNSVNFVPSSAESLTVSLNGVIQKPGSSYTVSSSTLTFSSSLSSSDSIDFIIAERGITLQTPSAGSVGTSQLASNAVTAAKINDGEITNAKISSTAAIATTKLGTGAVLQVVNTKFETQVTANNTLAATGMIASITPSSTSSKILVMTTLGGVRNSSGVWFEFFVYRQINGGGYSNLDKLEGGFLFNSAIITANMARNIMDTTHNTTNQIDYQIYFNPINGNGYLNVDGVESSTMTLMEIAG